MICGLGIGIATSIFLFTLNAFGKRALHLALPTKPLTIPYITTQIYVDHYNLIYLSSKLLVSHGVTSAIFEGKQ